MSMRIGYFGSSGTNTEAAARAMYNGDFISFSTIQELFQAVAENKVELSVVPIENSVEGSVGITNDLLYRHDLHIAGEYYLKISHCLVALPGMRLDSVDTVISHPQALGQCARFISDHGLKTIPFGDTASAVMALREPAYRNSAAIASENAAKNYGMEIIARNISDFEGNYTRFIAISRNELKPEAGKKYKASMVASLEDRPGSLLSVLEIFKAHEINLTKIESRPVKYAPWKYIFFMDFEYTSEKEAILKDLDKIHGNHKILGIYPMMIPEIEEK